MIRGTCPECGFQGDVVAFFVETDARQGMAEAARLPPELASLVIRYLGLFRPPERALSLSKATRLIHELADAVEAGTVERRGRAWHTTTVTWKSGLEAMLDARDRLTLPLKNHNYLYEILAGLADQIEGKAEQQVEAARSRGQHREPAPGAETRADPTMARDLLQGALAKLKGGSSAG